MAEGGLDVTINDFQWSEKYADNLQEQNDEVLVFKSLFEVEGDQRISVLNSGPVDLLDNEVFSVQFLVPVKTTLDGITVNVCIPEFDVEDGNEIHKDVVLQRSESRNRVFASFSVKFLTPLKLTVILPPEYPSESPPIFTLSCSWLDGYQLSSLCSQLDLLWNECPYMPILHTWVDWLEHNTLGHLGIKDTVFIQQSVTDDDIDTRAIPECENVDDTVNQMMRHTFKEEMNNFLRYDQECSICFCEKSGRNFIQFIPCKHYFCKECLSEHCSFHVREGTVQNLLCPEPKCKTEITPDILKDALNPEDFTRWERLILQYGLDLMGDIIYCPRCQNPVVENEGLGQCLSCLFTFCTKCYEKWHLGDCLANSEEDENKKKNFNVKKKSEKPFDELSEEEKLEIKRKRDLRLSLQLILNKTRSCVKCRAPIEKNGGCNKVTCSRCNYSICWACGVDITKESYAHFSKNPKCGELILDIDRNVPYVDPTPLRIHQIEDALLAGGKDVKRNIKRCTRCHQRNLRENNNNHMKCWNCRCNFCFLCASVLTPPFTKHFINTTCKQHSE